MPAQLHIVAVFPGDSKFGIEKFPQFGRPMPLPVPEKVIARVSTLQTGVQGTDRPVHSRLQVSNPEWLSEPLFPPFEVDMTLRASATMSEVQKFAALEEALIRQLPPELLDHPDGTQRYVLLMI